MVVESRVSAKQSTRPSLPINRRTALEREEQCVCTCKSLHWNAKKCAGKLEPYAAMKRSRRALPTGFHREMTNRKYDSIIDGRYFQWEIPQRGVPLTGKGPRVDATQ